MDCTLIEKTFVRFLLGNTLSGKGIVRKSYYDCNPWSHSL